MPKFVAGMGSIGGLSRTVGYCMVSMAVSAMTVDAQTNTEQVTTTVNKAPAADRVEVDEAHALYIPLQLAYKAHDKLEEIEDYECIFVKREVIGKKLIKASMKMKFREEPFSVYLKFLDNSPGREVLYVKGQNNNNLLVREAGFKSIIGTVALPPAGPDAMAESKHPITSIGMKQMLQRVIKQWELESKFDGTTTQKRPNSKLPTGEICTVFESVHEKPYKDFKFHTTRLWIEDKSGLPIGVQQLGFPGKTDKEPPLVEEYFYNDVKPNRKFTDTDFDKNNKSYSFR
ncbi:DUF1571 domain-containing protein [Schlesneria sp. DSM 10557]|uniref:DUF1571 domain-containing protein n=2 Tax=unclassified Schlesneria TaxID=2762017 RepID=UPI0035A00187